MKRSAVLLRRSAIMLVGLAVLMALQWEPRVAGRNALADCRSIYFGDPFLAYAQPCSIPFFDALQPAFRLIGPRGRRQVALARRHPWLRRIQYGALVIIGFVLGADVYIVVGAESDDHVEGVAMGVIAGVLCLGAAAVASVIKRKLGVSRDGACW